MGPRRSRDPARDTLARVGRPRRARPADLEPRAGDRPADRGRVRGLRRARGRVRRGADAGRSSATSSCRSSIPGGRSTWRRRTTSARASTSAASPRSIRLVAYKNEGYIMFQALMDSIWEEFARLIFHVDVEIQPNPGRRGVRPRRGIPRGRLLRRNRHRASPPRSPRPARAAAGAATATAPAAAAAPRAPRATAPATAAPTRPRSSRARTRRSAATTPAGADPGKKFKKCHGA